MKWSILWPRFKIRMNDIQQRKLSCETSNVEVSLHPAVVSSFYTHFRLSINGVVYWCLSTIK